MEVTRPNRPIMSLLALALLLAAGSLPATAQSGSEAVVCVGSERRTLATNPIRRVYTEDMEVVYRIGADIGQRDQVERDLSSELVSYPEVWCAWSDPGEDHAVIISYTGVIRQDLTVDPEDPRFQAFSVGFGTDFDEAESQATTINQRFSSYSDGSGFEVLLRETWSVAEGVGAAEDAPEPNAPEGPICTGSASSEGCWAEISNHPGCYLWNPAPQAGATVHWSGECLDGFAEGRGEGAWYWTDGEATETGVFRRGRRHGLSIEFYDDGVRGEGPYVIGERDGTWTYYLEDGRRSVGRFVNGERHGTWTESYDDGGRGEGPYVNGEAHGTWTIWFANGVRGVGPYVRGELHGTWTYSDDGDEWQVRYENGRRVGGFEGLVVLDRSSDSRFRSRTEAFRRGATHQLSTESAGRESAWRMAPCT